MNVTIRKIDLYPVGYEPSGRARTGEAIIVRTYRGLTSKRFEFDYDDDYFYVYCSVWPSGQFSEQLPVRAIPRKKA